MITVKMAASRSAAPHVLQSLRVMAARDNAKKQAILGELLLDLPLKVYLFAKKKLNKIKCDYANYFIGPSFLAA
jgi:hypothetical protein